MFNPHLFFSSHQLLLFCTKGKGDRMKLSKYLNIKLNIVHDFTCQNLVQFCSFQNRIRTLSYSIVLCYDSEQGMGWVRVSVCQCVVPGQNLMANDQSSTKYNLASNYFL